MSENENFQIIQWCVTHAQFHYGRLREDIPFGMEKTYIVFSLSDEFMDDHFKCKSYMEHFAGGYIMPIISDLLEDMGYTCISLDKFVKVASTKKAFLVTDIAVKKNTPIVGNLIPLMAFSLESPMYSYIYYSHIPWYSRKYKIIMDWEGISDIYPNIKKKLIPMKWPCLVNANISDIPKFNDRLTKVAFVSTNKEPFTYSSPSELFSRIKYNLSYTYMVFLRITRNFLSYSLYQDKIMIIKQLLDANLIDIYGKGWDDSKLLNINQSSLMGTVEDKRKAISKYKFALCIENMEFNGYLTEKIYDALFAYTIPIYLGDPDVHKKIPAGCYIDLRKFKNYYALTEYLENMSVSVYNDYMQSIKEFVSNHENKIFTCDDFATLISEKIEESK